MSAFDLRFHPTFPNELRPRFAAVLQRWAPFFTATISRIYVELGTTEGGGAFVLVRERYRDARITIDGTLLQESEQEQEEYLVHELAHLLTGPMQAQMQKLVKRFVPERLQEELQEDVIEATEAVTEDVARAVWAAYTGRCTSVDKCHGTL